MNAKEDTTYQNLWNAAKAVILGKFIAVNAYIKKNKIISISNLTFLLKTLVEE